MTGITRLHIGQQVKVTKNLIDGYLSRDFKRSIRFDDAKGDQGTVILRHPGAAGTAGWWIAEIKSPHRYLAVRGDSVEEIAPAPRARDEAVEELILSADLANALRACWPHLTPGQRLNVFEKAGL